MFLLEPKTWHESFLHTKKERICGLCILLFTTDTQSLVDNWKFIIKALLTKNKKNNKNNKKIKFDRNRDHSSLKHVFTA